MSEAKDFNNILIVGLGLIGGSIAKKLKDISYSGKVFGLDKDIDIIHARLMIDVKVEIVEGLLLVPMARFQRRELSKHIPRRDSKILSASACFRNYDDNWKVRWIRISGRK